MPLAADDFAGEAAAGVAVQLESPAVLVAPGSFHETPAGRDARERVAVFDLPFVAAKSKTQYH